jgi:hypothetical protein
MSLKIGTEETDINLEQFEVWIEALRSGNYPQTKSTLQDEVGFCCLGVACHVLIPDNLRNKDNNGRLVGPGPASSQQNAPDWLKNINMDFDDKTGHTLFYYNDELRLPFRKIADILENTYLTPYYESITS